MNKVWVVLILGFGMVVSTQSQAALAERYQCECVDTGVECDGLDYLTVVMNGAIIQAQAKDSDREPTGTHFVAKLDNSYRPRKYKDYDRYVVTSKAKKTYPYFLVHHTLSRDGWRNGNLKLIEKTKNDPSWTWEFKCVFDRYVSPTPIKGGASG